MIDTNIKLQQLKSEYEHSLVLNLLVRAAAPNLCQREEQLVRSNVNNVCHREEKLAAIFYEPAVVYDLRELGVLAVDAEGVAFYSQCSSSPTQPTALCTHERRNLRKDKLKAVMEEEPVFEQAHDSSDDSEAAYDSDNKPLLHGEVQDF